VKNCNKGKSGRKDFLERWLAEKECAFFSARDIAKNVRERAKYLQISSSVIYSVFINVRRAVFIISSQLHL
jgi:hypothetical protein